MFNLRFVRILNLSKGYGGKGSFVCVEVEGVDREFKVEQHMQNVLKMVKRTRRVRSSEVKIAKLPATSW
jgi:hypothetical protein